MSSSDSSKLILDNDMMLEGLDESVFSDNILAINSNLAETNVRFIGDITTISQIILLLAYIRHAILQNEQTEIKVKIGNNVINTQFAMDVNHQEIKDFITKSEIEIN